MPAAFFPLMEEGLGQDIGNWVLEQACKQAREWRDAGLGPIVACVNIAATQLKDATLLPSLKRILTRTGCEPSWLEFDVTESTLVRDIEAAAVLLGKLRAMGIRIAVDDFGTGSSSLAHLRHLPVDVLKIDKTFIADVSTGPLGRPKAGNAGAAIVSAIVGLANGLGLEVIAEGVEKASQQAFLKRIGCGFGQGYHLCPPLPVADLEKFLRARKKRPKK
jgi:EAL domain-containing protein (putative c-di-GMP-specific phosphodiesterase class I)